MHNISLNGLVHFNRMYFLAYSVSTNFIRVISVLYIVYKNICFYDQRFTALPAVSVY